jgi:hypothetical protein
MVTCKGKFFNFLDITTSMNFSAFLLLISILSLHSIACLADQSSEYQKLFELSKQNAIKIETQSENNIAIIKAQSDKNAEAIKAQSEKNAASIKAQPEQDVPKSN